MTSDKKIVEAIIKKKIGVFERFYQENFSKVLFFVKKQINDQFQAEEITQEVFIDFLEGLRDFRFQSSLKTYLFSIARYKIIDYLRKKKIKKVLFSALPNYLVEGLKAVFIDDEIEKKELRKKIKKVFKKLPNDYRLVLRLKYLEGKKVKAIAKKISASFKATESLIFRARKAFVKIFQSLD